MGKEAMVFWTWVIGIKPYWKGQGYYGLNGERILLFAFILDNTPRNITRKVEVCDVVPQHSIKSEVRGVYITFLFLLVIFQIAFIIIDWLKPILDLKENPNQPRPNHQPLTQGITFYWLDLWSSSNFQDSLPIIYQNDSWGQRWPYPLSLQSGTPNFL